MSFLRIVVVSRNDVYPVEFLDRNPLITLYFTGKEEDIVQGALLDKDFVISKVRNYLRGDLGPLPESLEFTAKEICELFDICCFKVDIQEYDGSVVSYEQDEDLE